MTVVPCAPAPVAPVLSAGLILAALPHFHALALAAPTVDEVVAAADVSRSRAYEVKAAIEVVAPTVLRKPGRPPQPESPGKTDASALTHATLTFVTRNPGSVQLGDERRRYTDEFRCFILDQIAERPAMDLAEVAAATHVPEPTLRDWLAGDRPTATPIPTSSTHEPTSPQIETIIAEFKTWKGNFGAFCDHVRLHHRIPFQRTLIASILETHRVRFRVRRPGRKPDADALRGQFETFFPAAQSVGDGSELTVSINGEPHTMNLELMVDPFSGGFVGASIRPTEDSAAVIEAFQDATRTMGQRPLAVLLDNKPSNHAEAVDDALGETLRIRATPFRPENKAHIEGGFGLFFQEAPALDVSATTRDELAAEVARLVVTTWGRAVNHRPRADRGGKSRVELHLGTVPTPDEIARAAAALKERVRRQEEARKTKAARQDPVMRQTIADAFARFGLADPEGHLLTTIAGYPLDAVVEAIAIFAARVRAGTLPSGADARYLLGIARNLAHDWELTTLAEELWAARRVAGDRLLARLDAARDRLTAERHDLDLVKACVDLALAAVRHGDRYFWLTAAADAISACAPTIDDREAWFRVAARRISATRAVPPPGRASAIRFVAAKLQPLA